MRKFRTIFILGSIFFLAAPVIAHPLGNFSVNQYSRLEVGKTEIKIRQVLDMAEIPTFQESAVIDADKDGSITQVELDDYAERMTTEYVSNLSVILNGEPLQLSTIDISATLATGAADLKTLHIVWDLRAGVVGMDPQNKVTFKNENFAERVGWREIVVNRTPGVEIYDSTAFGSNASDELRTFPEQLLSSPLGERAATFSFSQGSIPNGTRPLQNRDGHPTTALQRDRLAELIAVPEITPAIVVLGLLLAFGLGAVHAMSPGHGKTVVGAYLVGSRGTLKHAVFLGLTVTITHTLGVFILGLITLFASNFILPETLMPFLSFVSGLMVLYIGLTMFKSRLFTALGWEDAAHHHHGRSAGGHTHDDSLQGHSHDRTSSEAAGSGRSHTHSHDHADDEFTHTHDGHTHSHLPPDEISWKSLLALGVSGGLLPCPSALVLMLSAINLNRVGYGLVLTLVFSIGLAATLTAVGLAFLYGGKLFGGSSLAENRIFKALPVFSAFVIACVGAVICYNSLGASL